MATLNAAILKDVAKAASEGKGNFTPLPDGVYSAKLTGLEVKEGAKGNYWALTFTIPKDGRKFGGRKLFGNVSLSTAAHWRLAQFLKAFGVSMDSKFDSDTIMGKSVKLVVVTATQTQGKGAGNLINQIDEYKPADDAETDSDDDDAEADQEDDEEEDEEDL